MSKTAKVVLVVTGVIVVCLIGAGIVAGVYYAENGGHGSTHFFDIFSVSYISVDETHELDLSGISAVSVECASADIEFVADSEPRVEMKGSLWTPEEKEEYLSVTEKDGELLVRFDLITMFFVDADIIVYLPENCGVDLSVSCASGNTAIRQLALGDITLSCASGNAEIRGCTGGLLSIGAASGSTAVGDCTLDGIRVTCQSGNVVISDTKSAAVINCTSGKVSVTNMEGALDIDSISGNVDVNLPQKDIAPININVTSGKIDLSLSGQAAFNLEANTTSGGIHCEFERTVSDDSNGSIVGDHITGKCNGGGVSVTLSTVSGGINIRKH